MRRRPVRTPATQGERCTWTGGSGRVLCATGLVASVLLLAAACGGGGDPASEPAGAVEEATDAGSAAETAEAVTDRSADLRRRVETARRSDGVLRALGPGPAWRERFAGLELDELFAAVATSLRYEPYAGVLRGAEGTAIAGAGNAWDQALLLAELLRAEGFRVRFASGRLGSENAEVLIRGMYPPELPVLRPAGSLEAYDPAQDAGLRNVAESHVWVEVDQGGSWLPLDPAFPRARPGEAYAEPERRYEEPPEDVYHRLRVTVREESARGRTQVLGEVSLRVADVGYRPISIVGRAVPILEVPQAQGPAGPAGMLGGLAGAVGGRAADDSAGEPAADEAAPVPVGRRHDRRLELGEEVRGLASSTTRDDDPRSEVVREWLEIELTAPGRASRRLERTTYDAAQENPPAHRRFTLSVIPGPVGRSLLEEQSRRAREALPVEDWSRELARLEAEGAEGTDEEMLRVEEMERASGLATGHLANLAYAAESDALTGQIARAERIAVVHGTPRILIASVETREEGDGSRSEASLDLRLDEVDAYPHPGAAATAPVAFRTARGMQNALLEGEVLSAITGGGLPITTARLMERAYLDGVPLLVATPENRLALDEARVLPARERHLMETALEAGRHAVLPARAVQLEGRERWGWWEVDPESGHVIGVLEGGGHQATLEYKVSVKQVGLRDETAFILGLMAGSTSTHILVAAMILEYGGITPEALRRIENWLGNFMCAACPKAQIGAGTTFEVKVEGGCMEQELFKADLGISASIDFCGKYKDGFECASGMILAALRGEGAGITAAAEYKEHASASVGCSGDGYSPPGERAERTVPIGFAPGSDVLASAPAMRRCGS